MSDKKSKDVSAPDDGEGDVFEELVYEAFEELRQRMSKLTRYVIVQRDTINTLTQKNSELEKRVSVLEDMIKKNVE